MHTPNHTNEVVKIATEANPYRFLGSGLQNVYLVGVEYRTRGDEQAADVPCANELLAEIARVIVAQNAPLTGEELRFIRKAMHLPAKRLAESLDVADATYSKYENGHMDVSPQLSKLVRLIYVIVSKDPLLTGQANRIATENRWEAKTDGRRIIATLDANSHWQVVAA